MKGKSEFIGRALARDCYIRFSDQTYRTPQLQWFDVWKGDESAGQLLACFELIQVYTKIFYFQIFYNFENYHLFAVIRKNQSQYLSRDFARV